ncbi:MAG: RNA-binding protein [Candidatus Krumholzibacteria bacterium]|nr:RNA-binding protein [Candidatus Krumholzibacteria bacterium]
MKLYVGNLSFDTSESDLRSAFEAHGTVDSVAVVSDKFTGRSRGFGFIEMNNDEEAKAAMSQMNEKELDGRKLNVNEARPREDNRGGGGGGGGRY